MIERSFGRVLGRFRTGAWLRSSVTWIVLLVVALVGTGIAIREKGRGHLHKLKTELGERPPVVVVSTPQPGGQDAVVLTRAQQEAGITPEFLSATLLPGRGMNVLQIMAFLPGKGEVPLLDAPSLQDAARSMTGIEGDVNGEVSLAMGGAIEVPWAGQVSGAALPGGTSVLANWRGRGITLPVNSAQGGSAGAQGTGTQSSVGGLLLKDAADSASPSVMPDGGVVQGVFNAGSFEGHWPSKTEVRTTVLLSARTMDVTIIARNVGSEPEPMGIGWRPRFAIPAGQRSQVTLKLPSMTRAETKDRESGLPTGRLLPVEGTEYDFASRSGAALQASSLNDTYVHLKTGALSTGAEAEIRNPAAGYGIRITALSPSIKAMRVYAPAGESMISIDPQTNYDDPFGREWSKDEDTGMVVLQPGESMQWKVRLELFPISGPAMGPG
ncbi:aldose epimerase family protein [Granulicella arctica]|uniref:aldose epimerase family protein n=1 Tax=Granulicella arctica TaxID=940613 RepID=UPI0021E055CF|nr:hypothetical protein [Granulicella arctica]